MTQGQNRVVIELDAREVEGLIQGWLAGEYIDKALAIFMQLLRGKLSASYPPEPAIRPTRKSVYGRAFVSEAQRKYVMMLIREGKVPYLRGISERSEQLGKRWIVAKRRKFEYTLINRASYSGYVLGAGQARYMRKLGWKRAGDIAESYAPQFRRVLLEVLDE